MLKQTVKKKNERNRVKVGTGPKNQQWQLQADLWGRCMQKHKIAENAPQWK